MKHKNLLLSMLIVIATVFVVSACSNNEAENDTTNQKENDTEETDNDNESVHEEGTNNEADEDKEQEEQEEEVAKQVDVEYEIHPVDSSVIPINDADEKVVLLTIDDAPDKHALEMASTLKDLDANAIFFVNGHFLNSDEQKETLKKIHEMGFVIGNHTMTHENLTKVDEQTQRQEIVELSDKIEEIIGERPKFFRAPHGANTDFSRQLVEEEKMVLMNWTYGYDYFAPYQDAEKIKQAMISGEGPEVDVPYSLLKPGANLLMHDREWTNAALADIVTGLRDKGYTMVDPRAIKTIE
ncbi:polysaccharide deacetylase family protein [Paraliobacillus salinarum]|uniref:polysaccharide deacetylase family protein n=1 Tax=Paraliobacillus salinarum TaxID=1158996 RepID=UPI0015F45F2B|nr:polysaccharide deacetylase family protein [Paraliobacillus salinarum]